MQHFKKLMGDRLYLSPKSTSEEATDKFTTWMNDFQVTDYIGSSAQITTWIGEQAWLEQAAKKTENRVFDIIEKTQSNLIGTIGLERFDWINRSAELGIFIGEDMFRNQGYGKEAINLLLEYGFHYLNLHSIRLSLIAVNERAQKCYMACGFKVIGRYREAIYLNGRYYDQLFMDILEHEFTVNSIRNKHIK